MIAVQNERRRAVATAQVADAISGSNRRALGDQTGQVIYRLLGGFVSRDPVAVMNISSPDASVQVVEIVVVSRNVGDVWDRGGRRNHGHLTAHFSQRLTVKSK